MGCCLVVTSLACVSEVDEVADWSALQGIPSALAGARDALDALLRDRGLRRTTPALTAESLLRGAAASALLDNSASDSFDDAIESLRTDEGGPVATAAARLNASLLSLVPVVNRSPLQALARIHTLAAVGRVHEDALGRPRPEAGVASRLQWLSRMVLGATDVPAIAVAGIAHAEVATLAPFEVANGLVARAVERLLLVARGVDPTSMTVPEAGHLALQGDYRQALEAYAAGDLVGRRTWLLHVASAVTAGVASSPLR